MKTKLPPQSARHARLARACVAAFLCAFLPSVALAAAEPVEISAAKSLEWNRKAKTYTAHKDVVMRQGAVRIQSDTLTARYTDAAGAADITQLEAQGGVVIHSDPYVAYGDRAVYDVKTGRATLTGSNLRIIAGQDTLTAKDKIEFFGAENRLSAVGGAVATRQDYTLSSEVLNAYFKKNTQGKLSAEKIAAPGPVTITTSKETVTGDEGVYNVPSRKAVLTGRVRIKQGENWLQGTRADIDMATGMSQLSGSQDDGGRVKGVFYPKQKTQ